MLCAKHILGAETKTTMASYNEVCYAMYRTSMESLELLVTVIIGHILPISTHITVPLCLFVGRSAYMRFTEFIK